MKIFVVSLGCDKNSVDTELVLGELCRLHGEIEPVEVPEDADVIFVNTCGFLESAVEESIETILELSEHRAQDQILAVSGCMVQRYGSDLIKELSEVDIFHGTEKPEEMAVKISKRLGQAEEGRNTSLCAGTVSGRLVTTPPWRAFVKVSEGCSNRCTYCLIPGIRGKNRCRSVEDIVSEIDALASMGTREVTLLAQDLTAYSHEGRDLASLLNQIVSKTDVSWIRLLYMHPQGITGSLLDVIASNSERICPYLDIPVQHASSRILRRMGRGYDRTFLDGLFKRIRTMLPEAALRTTVMTGFPGETQDDFNELLSFIEQWRFMHLGCFAYSDEGDCAAHRLDDKVDVEVAEERKEQVMGLQSEISRAINSSLVGSVQDVLVEGLSQETDLLLEARSRFQAPEVDGVTYIADGTANEGEIVKVRITDAHVYDLVGEIV